MATVLAKIDAWLREKEYAAGHRTGEPDDGPVNLPRERDGAIQRAVDADRFGPCDIPHDPFKKNPLADDCLIALAAGELSEGQAAALTGINRLSIRQAMQSAIKNAQDAWGEYRKHNPASPE